MLKPPYLAGNSSDGARFDYLFGIVRCIDSAHGGPLPTCPSTVQTFIPIFFLYECDIHFLMTLGEVYTHEIILGVSVSVFIFFSLVILVSSMRYSTVTWWTIAELYILINSHCSPMSP